MEVDYLGIKLSGDTSADVEVEQKLTKAKRFAGFTDLVIRKNKYFTSEKQNRMFVM